MTNEPIMTAWGLELEAPSPGDIVSVRLKPCPGTGLTSVIEDQSTNPQHYRHTALWRVVAINGAHAVVEALTESHRRELWVVNQHRWFDATELWEALGGEHKEEG